MGFSGGTAEIYGGFAGPKTGNGCTAHRADAGGKRVAVPSSFSQSCLTLPPPSSCPRHIALVDRGKI